MSSRLPEHLAMQDWKEHPSSPHLYRYTDGRKEWMAHCTKCGLGTHEQRHEPAADYLCDDCLEEQD